MKYGNLEHVNHGVYYPLADEYKYCLPIVNGQRHQITPGATIKARWDGKAKRKPRRGEWYLSGAFIAAYLSPSDLDYKFHIAELYEVTEVTTRMIVSAVKIG